MDKQLEIKFLEYHRILEEMERHLYRCSYHMVQSLIIVSEPIIYLQNWKKEKN